MHEITPTNDLTLSSGQSKGQTWKPILIKAASIILFLHIWILPFIFGGVHENIILPLRGLTALVFLTIILFDYQELRRSFNQYPTAEKVLGLMCVCFSFCILHSLIYQYVVSIVPEHPTISSARAGARPLATLSQIMEFGHYLILFCCVIYFFNKGLQTDPDQDYRLEPQIDSWSKTIIGIGALVSITALAHWFYDNGKLFWIFSANYDFTSTRARWPFVNSNHLAIFLAIPYFLSISKLESILYEAKKSAANSLHRGKMHLGEFLSKKSTQTHLKDFIICSSVLLTISLAIIGSLSRNAGISIFVLTIIYFVLPRKSKKVIPTPISALNIEASQDSSQSSRVRTRKERRSSTTRKFDSFNADTYLLSFKRFLKIGIILASIWILSFFLGERGGELFKSRIEYALLYTQDDMRWQMYTDSLPMILDYYWLGIGLGNWAAAYPSYMSTGLSGMEPAYLHSDILQLLIELGIIGFLIFAFSFTYWLLKTLRPVTIEHGYKIRFSRLALSIGVSAVIICAAFEFPFRIPAISSLFVICLALGSIFSSINPRYKE
jgi:hypothetical protein